MFSVGSVIKDALLIILFILVVVLGGMFKLLTDVPTVRIGEAKDRFYREVVTSDITLITDTITRRQYLSSRSGGLLELPTLAKPDNLKETKP